MFKLNKFKLAEINKLFLRTGCLADMHATAQLMLCPRLVFTFDLHKFDPLGSSLVASKISSGLEIKSLNLFESRLASLYSLRL